MKKTIFLLPLVLLLAAGCNSTGISQQNQSADVSAKASGNVDAISASLQSEANNEQSAVQQSDPSSSLNSDSSTLDGYTGVANGSAY